MAEDAMDALKAVIGGNLVALRRAAGLTQSDLAEKLNYSDKAVSKWECGDATPDILVLKRIATLYGVTVDYLTQESHDEATVPKFPHAGRNKTVITGLSALLVWLIATAVYVSLSLLIPGRDGLWLAFVTAIPVSSLVVFILCCVWHRRPAKYISLSLTLWGALLTVFLFCITFCRESFFVPWMIFLIGIPGQAIIALWSVLHMRRPTQQG